MKKNDSVQDCTWEQQDQMPFKVNDKASLTASTTNVGWPGKKSIKSDTYGVCLFCLFTNPLFVIIINDYCTAWHFHYKWMVKLLSKQQTSFSVFIWWCLIHDRFNKKFAHTDANFSCKLDWKIKSGMFHEANRQNKMIVTFFYETFFYESVEQIFANKTSHWTS